MVISLFNIKHELFNSSISLQLAISLIAKAKLTAFRLWLITQMRRVATILMSALEIIIPIP